MKRDVERTINLDGRSAILRPSDSDLFVVAQTHGHKEYDIGDRTEPLRELARSWRSEGVTPIIIDAGANVGYSSLYFAEQYPEALVIALEPHPQTFAMLERNCAQHPRIKVVQGALWLDEKGVSIRSGEDQSWSHSVTRASANAVPSFTVDGVRELMPNSKTLILKMDIEGAEREACVPSSDTLKTCPCIMVEPHDFMLPGAACMMPLIAQIANRRMDTLLLGEKLVFLDAAIST
ncbi:FkbM family methyltransferase [Bradyrhizobium australiense]|uniref:FkbM family methyltransferase n=1 Tax=Bradyrhizobium australiense TaxID=2721161 RepID=A0A7Y4LXN2_9BRAD|nr:FkbM family methyltransferase [Bradyrhizobium australiense]NOJ42673.1 FkbM family methyltransferase [Bradyrhizobium australiense]